MCIKIIVWGVGEKYNLYFNLLSLYERVGEIRILGVTADDSYYKSIDGYQYIRKKDLPAVEFDFIMVSSFKYYKEIMAEIQLMNIPFDKVMRMDVLNIPGFSFSRYKCLMTQFPTIISNNCWGGVTYHFFKRKFCSPFINMFMEDDDYIKLVSNLREYVHGELKFIKMQYNETEKFSYPVFLLNDVKLYMNHYRNIDEAVKKWNSRKKRIKWNNLYIMMYTESQEIAESFDCLPYKKKICFVPFKTKLHSCMEVKPYADSFIGKKPFWEIVNGMASGKYAYYDAWELLLNGRRIYRVDRGE